MSPEALGKSTKLTVWVWKVDWNDKFT